MKAAQVAQHERVAKGGCLATYNRRQVVIYDHKKMKGQPAAHLRIDGHCYVREPAEEAMPHDFTVHNPRGKTFHFVAVDKCMFSDKEKKLRRCDCLIFTENLSLFIDLKEVKSPKAQRKARLEAVEQICASIDWFLTENLLESGEEVEVIVATGNRKRSPRFNDAIISKTAELEQLFPSLAIRYGGEISFRKL